MYHVNSPIQPFSAHMVHLNKNSILEESGGLRWLLFHQCSCCSDHYYLSEVNMCLLCDIFPNKKKTEHTHNNKQTPNTQVLKRNKTVGTRKGEMSRGARGLFTTEEEVRLRVFPPLHISFIHLLSVVWVRPISADIRWNVGYGSPSDTGAIPFRGLHPMNPIFYRSRGARSLQLFPDDTSSLWIT